MKKLVALAAVLVALLATAPSAAAHPTGLRDPFEPLISPEDETATATSTATTEAPEVGTATTIDETDQGLPTTGSDPSSWLAVAYFMIAAGAGALAFARLASPRRSALTHLRRPGQGPRAAGPRDWDRRTAAGQSVRVGY